MINFFCFVSIKMKVDWKKKEKVFAPIRSCLFIKLINNIFKLDLFNLIWIRSMLDNNTFFKYLSRDLTSYIEAPIAQLITNIYSSLR